MCQKEPPCQIMQAGPVSYTHDGCVMQCSHPQNSHLTDLAPVGMGDACPWECDFGYFMQRIIVDQDQNETGWVCVACSPSVCAPNVEEYHPLLCNPQSQLSDFCIRCPSPAFAQLVVGSVPGQCQYSCLPNVSYQSSVDHQCKPCYPPQPATDPFCPAGFRRLPCAENPCVACPQLPKGMWSSAVAMQSNTNLCLASCRDGYHTLNLSTGQVLPPSAYGYDPPTTACAPCGLRPSLPCPMHVCPPGYFMLVAGSGICLRCPTLYDCPLGTFPSGCICTQCPAPAVVGQVPVLQADVDLAASKAMVLGAGKCPTVCPPNTMLLKAACVVCSTLNAQSGLSFFAIWNASNGSRWWPVEQVLAACHG